MISNPMSLMWETKYRPSTIDECILPVNIKNDLNNMVKENSLDNLLLVSSKSGTGKTTVARAICNDLGNDYLFINASESGGIGELRSTVRDYVSTFSLDGDKRIVILDEFDQASKNFQNGFKGFIEEFTGNARFILTANNKNAIIDAIQSRMNIYEFIIPESEKLGLMKQSVNRCQSILKSENIPCTNIKVLLELVRRNYPDNRKVMVQLQKYSRTGAIDEGILGRIVANDDISSFIKLVKDKNFKKIREMIPSLGSNYPSFIRSVYDIGFSHAEPNSIPDLILYINDNMESASRCADIEIHIAALSINLMRDISWK